MNLPSHIFYAEWIREELKTQRTSTGFHTLLKMTGTAAGTSNCSHITSTLTTTDLEEGDFVKKYKSVVSWYSHRSSQCHPSKRRKVSKMMPSLSFYVEFTRADCCTNMWNVWYCTVSAFCVLSVLVCRMLVGWTCCHASKRIGSLVLQVTPSFSLLLNASFT